jgi:hypothetical protein
MRFYKNTYFRKSDFGTRNKKNTCFLMDAGNKLTIYLISLVDFDDQDKNVHLIHQIKNQV